MNMSFGRLLAAGKSWVGGEGTGRYRMREGIRLPKFISPRNPFKPEPGAEAPSLPRLAPATTAVMMADAAPMAEGIPLWARVGAGLRRAVWFCLEQNPLARLGQPQRPAIPRFGKAAVQEEFSLENVQVVRGDLTHADLEIVAAGPPEAGPAWKNLTVRMFGAQSK
jgi:hypothetical protein